jgi:hypothetical protein
MKSVAFRRRENVLILAHGKFFDDEDWEYFLDFFRGFDEKSAARALIFSSGGAPSAKQRRQFAQLLAGAHPRIAALSDSQLVRYAGVALHWFNPQLRIFATHEVPRALDHLTITDRTLRERVAADLVDAKHEFFAHARPLMR